MVTFMKILFKVLSIIIGIVIILGILFFIVDYSRVKNNQIPIFCIPVGIAMDGGTIEYLGLGYKVIDFNTISGYDDIKIGTWTMKYSDFDDEISKYDKIKEQQIEIIQNSKVATIEVEKTPKKSENSNKSYTLTIKEMYQVLTLIETLNFIPKTCINENESVFMTYNIEAGDGRYHISCDDKTEAILSTSQNNQLNEIINKYF